MKKIEGIENIKKVLWKSVLVNDSGNLRSIITGKPLVYYFGGTFAEDFMQARKQKGIFLQSLRLTNQNFDSKEHQDYAGYLKEIQHIDSEQSFNFSGIFLWDTTVVVFYLEENEYCEYNRGSDIYKKYDEIFNGYWIKT